MLDDHIFIIHYQEMANRKYPIYRLFEILNQANLSPESIIALRKEASQLTEFVVGVRAVASFILILSRL